MNQKIFLGAACLAVVLAGCGDDNTQINNSQTVSIVSKLDKKTVCESDNDGEVLYVKDSSSYFYCNGESWTRLYENATIDTVVKEVEMPTDTLFVDKIDTLYLDKIDTLYVKDSIVVVDTVYVPTESPEDSSKTPTDEPEKKENVCGDVEFSPLYKFCHNDVLYSLCEGVKYNPDNQECDNGSPVNLETCGTGSYNPNKKFCTVDEKILDLCGGKSYNPETQKCEDQEVATYATCGNTTYNIAKKMCDTRDNRLYAIVSIGTQTWFAQNLNYATNQSWCYENNAEYCESRGRLYRTSSAATACPSGWHLPTKNDALTLVNTVGANAAAKHLKATEGWGTNNNGVDDFGFHAQPAGYGYHYYQTPRFYDLNYSFQMWVQGSEALTMKSGETHSFQKDNESSFSIRCIKN